MKVARLFHNSSQCADMSDMILLTWIINVDYKRLRFLSGGPVSVHADCSY